MNWTPTGTAVPAGGALLWNEVEQVWGLMGRSSSHTWGYISADGTSWSADLLTGNMCPAWVGQMRVVGGHWVCSGDASGYNFQINRSTDFLTWTSLNSGIYVGVSPVYDVISDTMILPHRQWSIVRPSSDQDYFLFNSASDMNPQTLSYHTDFFRNWGGSGDHGVKCAMSMWSE